LNVLIMCLNITRQELERHEIVVFHRRWSYYKCICFIRQMMEHYVKFHFIWQVNLRSFTW